MRCELWGGKKQSIITLEFWTIATWLMFISYLNKSISSVSSSPMIAFKRKWEERDWRQKIQIISKSLAGKGEQKGGLAARGKKKFSFKDGRAYTMYTKCAS